MDVCYGCMFFMVSDGVFGLSVHLSFICRMSDGSEYGPCVFGSLLKLSHQPRAWLRSTLMSIMQNVAGLSD